MSYTAELFISIPASLYDIACAIGRSLDPDLGGDKTFGPRQIQAPDVLVTPESTDGDGNVIPAVYAPGELFTPERYTTSTPCTDEFKAEAMVMLHDPETLFYVVSADYARRWTELTAPTIEDCIEFCAGVTLE